MVHIETSIVIHAPPEHVMAAYRDYHHWPQIFPTIKGVRLTREQPGQQVLEIDHQEGRVVNVLTDIAPDEIELQEWKKRYDATFRNCFQPIPAGTRYTLCADIALKGFYRLLTPFVRGYIRRQMVELVLEPVRMAAVGRF